VAKELGINEGTLGNWVAVYRREHAGEEPPLTVNERARLRQGVGKVAAGGVLRGGAGDTPV
jgi:transposase-like protein